MKGIGSEFCRIHRFFPHKVMRRPEFLFSEILILKFLSYTNIYIYIQNIHNCTLYIHFHNII